MAQAPGDQRDRQRQRGEQVPGRKPEAEHGRREEARDQQLGAERGGADRRGQLDVAHPRHGTGEPVAVRAPQQPESGEGEQEHRRPAQQAVFAVDEERDEPVDAGKVATGEAGIGGALAGDVGVVGGGTAVDRLVDADVEGDAEQTHLDGRDRQRAPAHAPQRPGGDVADHQACRHELRAQPRQRTEQQKAGDRVAPPRARVELERQQRAAGEDRPRGQLGVDGGPVGEEGWRQADDRGGADRPRVGNDPQRDPVGERDRQRGDRGQEQLDAGGAAERVGGGDQQREADAMRLVELSLGLAAVAVEQVGVELGVGLADELVAHVDVAVLDDRLRRQQVVGLVARVVGIGEGVDAERRGVGAEEQQEQGERPSHELSRQSDRTACRG